MLPFWFRNAAYEHRVGNAQQIINNYIAMGQPQTLSQIKQHQHIGSADGFELLASIPLMRRARYFGIDLRQRATQMNPI
jgi:hypothetical protein